MWTWIAAAAVRALFVGNSLTTVNDLPRLVEQIAASAHQPFTYRVVAFDGYSLEDHWARGDAQRAIAEGGWTVVILQQGPSSLPESRRLLIDYTQRFAAAARKVGATPALYMVWPAQSRLADSEGVRLSYTSAAQAVHGLLMPAGSAWRAAARLDGHLALYGEDGFHPTPTGSYLAALVVFDALFHVPPPQQPPATIPAAVMPTLLAAVKAVNVPRAF
jgi:hypothetical protein